MLISTGLELTLQYPRLAEFIEFNGTRHGRLRFESVGYEIDVDKHDPFAVHIANLDID
jgi:hypothetical protein